MEINVAGKKRHVYIERKRNRNMYLRLDADMDLHITCPYGTPNEEILRFIYDKEDWIRKTTAHISQRIEYDQTGEDSDHAYWLGRKMDVQFEDGMSDFMLVDERKVTYFLRERSAEAIRTAFYTAASHQLIQLIRDRREKWDQCICLNHGKPVPKIALKYMTSRWGSCTPAKAHISISLRLIHYPIICLDYVLLHEYAHMLEPNHSKNFYQIIETYMPDYKEAIRLLKGE